LHFRPVFNTLALGEPLNSGSQNLAIETRETSLYCMVLEYWQTIISCHNSTHHAFDERADRQTDRKATAIVSCNRCALVKIRRRNAFAKSLHLSETKIEIDFLMCTVN